MPLAFFPRIWRTRPPRDTHTHDTPTHDRRTQDTRTHDTHTQASKSTQGPSESDEQIRQYYTNARVTYAQRQPEERRHRHRYKNQHSTGLEGPARDFGNRITGRGNQVNNASSSSTPPGYPPFASRSRDKYVTDGQHVLGARMSHVDDSPIAGSQSAAASKKRLPLGQARRNAIEKLRQVERSKRERSMEKRISA